MQFVPFTKSEKFLSLFPLAFPPPCKNTMTGKFLSFVSGRNTFTYKLSILKSGDGDPEICNRYFYEYTPKAGVGHFIHTYRCDGNPIPSFEGEPEQVAIRGNIDEFTTEVWNSLNADNKVSLFTRFINLATGEYETRIINKNN